MQWNGIERRMSPRLEFPCFIKVKNKKENVMEGILTHTENISIGGVYVILKDKIEMGSLIHIEIDLLDGGAHIKCQGKVVRCQQRPASTHIKSSFFDVGLEFVGVGEGDKSHLQAALGRFKDKEIRS